MRIICCSSDVFSSDLCDRGAIPALASGYDIPLILDDNIYRQPDIYFEAGDHESLIHMSHDEFARLTANARHGNFSMHEAMLHCRLPGPGRQRRLLWYEGIC